MKKLIYILLAIISINAQAQSKFGAELTTSPIAVGLQSSDKVISAGAFGVNFLYFPIEKWSIKIGFDGLHLLQSETQTFNSLSMLRLGSSYVLFNDTKRNTNWEINLSVGNDIEHFSKFTNYDLAMDLRFFIHDAFYMGIGARQMRFNNLKFENYITNNTNLYFVTGYRVRF